MKEFIKITEAESLYSNLEEMSTQELLININNEDKKVAFEVEKIIPEIEKLVDIITKKLSEGGKLFYIGAGTSGRLGIVDASECPPTFGVDHNLVIGLMAGGDKAMRKAVEFAEDDTELGWKDLKKKNITSKDIVIGIAASGTTPYVIGALKVCLENKITTGSISCNLNSPLSNNSNYPIEVSLGPEFLSGSSRMKSGTAQKLILNMISTSVMIKLGYVKNNRMVDMQLSNNKLIERAIKMVVENTNCTKEKARTLLTKYGSVREVINVINKNEN
ncbi:N-acetylmuramic acid 6-phosphate etherase [Croceibacter atlanticus]|jgi:N-acetylmuramic acid 6-phosphate etherase|uniref:N-acetylmuramic acid 6-phosphate etherase n=1 Tax=Croceibacter atlanticus (strain ATCC BAA-628 / JCM 21780 / CIP 108009 / IAM 15332 / KCTC 12090 / HTCC2559) TaxID=216432 RepID=A3U924_CROAH|nr:N-acetylmuramic acid 6-phosphate etherase [Croceibacter atlanticus]EAP86310.1 glucokinase regulator-related protein [Croceibacter atlanticus HTCC2559]